MASDIEIERNKVALLRHHATLDDMARQWREAGGVCCPGCMFGAQHSEAAGKAERCAKWLCVLLRRRGTEADERLAEAIEMSAWP